MAAAERVRSGGGSLTPTGGGVLPFLRLGRRGAVLVPSRPGEKGADVASGRRWKVVGCAALAVAIGLTSIPAGASEREVRRAVANASLQPAPGAKATADHSCNSQAVVSCLLPYPSEQYLRPDPSSATGYRVDVPADILPAELLGQLGPGASVEEAYGGADGFSAIGPVVFELPDPADPKSLPADGGDAFVVVDLDTRERIPMKVEVSADAERLWGKDRIVVGFPRDRFRYGGRYVAVLTDQLRGPQGAAIRPGPGLDPFTTASAEDRQAASRLRSQIATALPDLPQASVIAATSFVVRSEENVTGDIDRMAAMVRADEHPIKDIWVGASWVPGAPQVVTGKVRVTDFRDENGVIPRGDAITPRHHWIDFMMLLPEFPAGRDGAPVAIYGHGLAVQRETLLTVATKNSLRGIATVAIDIPNHGSRWWAEGGYLTELATPHRFGRMASMPLQGILDNLSLLQAVKTSFGSLDLHPVRNWWFNAWGDGKADLDTRHVIYQGTSMGGFLGASFVALAPELDGAFVHVGGTGIVDTLFHSLLWPVFYGIAPWGSTAGDAHALLGAAGMMLDRADNVYLIERIRRNRTPFYLVYGDQDGIVPNTSSMRMVRLMGLPLLAPTYHDAPDIAVVDQWPADGFGASQFDTWEAALRGGGPIGHGFLAHVWFNTGRPSDEMDRWLDDRLAEMRSEG